jgi:hypothetical protein
MKSATQAAQRWLGPVAYAVLIIIIAWFNYINLATAKSRKGT